MSQFKAIAINYSTLSGSTIVASTLTNISTVSVSTIYDSTLNANSITVTSTIATSTMTVSGSLNVSGPLQIYGNQLIPIGCIMLFYSSSIPAGWALCNGQTVTRIDGGGTITTPNLIGQFVYGGSTAGTTGGSATQTLSVAQLPAHNHAVSDSGHSHTLSDSGHTHTAADSGHTHTDSGHTHTDSGHTHNISSLPDQWSASGAGPVTFFSGSKYGPAGPYSTNNSSANLTTNSANIQSAKAQISVTSATTGITLANATTGITTQNTGSGSAFSIMPPYIVLCYIMKY